MIYQFFKILQSFPIIEVYVYSQQFYNQHLLYQQRNFPQRTHRQSFKKLFVYVVITNSQFTFNQYKNDQKFPYITFITKYSQFYLPKFITSSNMSEIRSNSSYAMSAIQFNSKSLNPLDSIHPSVLSKIKREADTYIGCSAKCAKIWTAISKNDIAGSHMTQNVIQVIFKEFQQDLSSLTKVSSVKQFMKVFDQDKDGCLSSDQQIQIFSFVKQRLELVANNCLQIQSYIKFEALMKQVRILESYIAKWQQQLRLKIHHTQIRQYRKQGQNKIDQFCDMFDRQFQQLQRVMVHRRENFQKEVFYQTQALEQRLGQPSQYLKIKPKNRLKELQFQEKLVSLEQRVYEALDFRRELNQLQIVEKDRVDKLMLQHAEQQRQNLRAKHHKKRKQLQQKLEEMQNKLMIKMKKQFEVLKKKNTLHQIEIRRLQGLEKKWAEKKGLFEPELKRTKKLQKQRNEVLSQFKKSMLGATKLDEDTIGGAGQQSGGASNKFNAKSILGNTIKFKLSNRSQSDIPINSKAIKVDNNFSNKIHKYITPQSAEKNYSLCKLYDSDLKQKQEKAVVNQQILDQEKSRKYNFMMSKLL